MLCEQRLSAENEKHLPFALLFESYLLQSDFLQVILILANSDPKTHKS